MVEKLKLQDFDILGILELKDIQGIEKFVTPIKDEEGRTKSYLSRSKEYYNVKTMSELAICREELQHLLTRECSKRNFVLSFHLHQVIYYQDLLLYNYFLVKVLIYF